MDGFRRPLVCPVVMYCGTSYSNPYASGGYASAAAPSAAQESISSAPLKPLVAPVYGGAASCGCSSSPSAAGTPVSPSHLTISTNATPVITMPSVVETRSPRPYCLPASPSVCSGKSAQPPNFKVEVGWIFDP